MKCFNCNCDKDPLKSINKILINTDGDFVCSEECKEEYLKQRDYFFNNIISSKSSLNEWFYEGCK